MLLVVKKIFPIEFAYTKNDKNLRLEEISHRKINYTHNTINTFFHKNFQNQIFRNTNFLSLLLSFLKYFLALLSLLITRLQQPSNFRSTKRRNIPNAQSSPPASSANSRNHETNKKRWLESRNAWTLHNFLEETIFTRSTIESWLKRRTCACKKKSEIGIRGFAPFVFPAEDRLE